MTGAVTGDVAEVVDKSVVDGDVDIDVVVVINWSVIVVLCCTSEVVESWVVIVAVVSLSVVVVVDWGVVVVIC